MNASTSLTKVEPPPNLYAYALERAQESARLRELPAIAEATKLGYSWLSKFARGKIPGASYEMVYTLATFYMARDAARAAAGVAQVATIDLVLGPLAPFVRDDERGRLALALERGPDHLYRAIEALEVPLDVRAQLLAAAQRCEERAT